MLTMMMTDTDRYCSELLILGEIFVGQTASIISIAAMAGFEGGKLGSARDLYN